MALEIQISNNVDQKMRDQLNGNFVELDKSRVNVNGYEFPTTSDRLNYIEKAIKQLGLTIDPREESEEI